MHCCVSLPPVVNLPDRIWKPRARPNWKQKFEPAKRLTTRPALRRIPRYVQRGPPCACHCDDRPVSPRSDVDRQSRPPGAPCAPPSTLIGSPAPPIVAPPNLRLGTEHASVYRTQLSITSVHHAELRIATHRSATRGRYRHSSGIPRRLTYTGSLGSDIVKTVLPRLDSPRTAPP